ncbi:hypothetical protein KBA27_06815, partial [bacterium]|nr:hypothetical protein [bacterium]
NLKYEDVVVKGGKVLDNGKAYEVPKNAVEINYDTKFYKNSMNFIYNTALDKDTNEILGKNLSKEINNYRAKIYDGFSCTPPETKEPLTTTDFDFVNSIGNNRHESIQNCKNFDEVKDLFKGYKPYEKANSLQELMQMAGVSNVNSIDDLKNLSKELHNSGLSETEYYKAPHALKKYFSTSNSRFNDMGQTLDECITSIANEKFNSKTWLKKFSVAGGILLGITVVSQLFFGKNNEKAVGTKKVSKKG